MSTMAGLLPSKPDIDPNEDPRVVGLDSDAADELIDALSSTTTRKILAALHEEPASASALADRVDTSIQNVQYHLRKLEDAGLVEVGDTVYSEKGREMNVYVPADRALVVVAGREEETTGLKAALSRLIGGIGVLGLASVVVDRLARRGLSVGPGAGGEAAEGGDAGDAGGGAATTDGGTSTPDTRPTPDAQAGGDGGAAATPTPTATATEAERGTATATETDGGGFDIAEATTTTTGPTDAATATPTPSATGTSLETATPEPGATETAATTLAETATPAPTAVPTEEPTPAPASTSTPASTPTEPSPTADLTAEAVETVATTQPSLLDGVAASPGLLFFFGGTTVLLGGFAIWWVTR
jgi:DNA-binding transcriptional ArsR family regulator